MPLLDTFDKVISNAQEAKARDSYLIGIAPECNGTEIFDYLMQIPSSNEWVSPLLNIVPLQLLSYHIAAHRRLDVVKRNLAKSVTVGDDIMSQNFKFEDQFTLPRILLR